MRIYRSRYTPGIEASETCFAKGDVVTYQLLNGKTTKFTVMSEPMTHHQCKTFGYEGVFEDTGEYGFADVARIIDWKGKS